MRYRFTIGALALLAAFVACPTSAPAVQPLANDNDFQTPSPTFINFEDITLCSGGGCTTFINVDRYQSLGAHISDGADASCGGPSCPLTGTSAAAAFSGTLGGFGSGCGSATCPVSPHSGTRGIGDSDWNIPGGCVVIRFVTPGTTTPTSVFEAGLWVHGGKEDDCVQFLDANQTMLMQFNIPGDFWSFVGVRAPEGVRFIRITGTTIGLPSGGGYLIDDLKFGGTPMPTNQPPVITQGATASLNVACNSNCPLSANNVALSATDPDGPVGTLQWSIMTPPTRGTLSPTTGMGGSFTTCYDPNNGQGLPDSFVVKVTDTAGGSDTILVNVTVTNTNPTITQGATINRPVLRNSTCGCPLCPDTANIVTVSATDTESAGSGLSWTIPTLPSNGSVCFENGVQTGASVNVRYTPTAGQSNPDSFAVRVTDECGGTQTTTVNITVNAACTLGERGDLNNDGAVNAKDVQRFCDVLLNLPGATAMEKCRADIGALAPSTCTPDGATNPNDVAGFVLILLGGACNMPPVITQGSSTSLVVAANSNCPNAANNITLNATDPDGSPASLSWSIPILPTNGIVSPTSGLGGAFTVCYDPNNGQSAADFFVVRVTDPIGAFVQITVNVTVDNLPPVITEGATANLSVGLNTDCPNAANNLTLNATDPDGAAANLAWTIQTQPNSGTVSPQNGAGAAFTICYDPTNGQSAADSFVVRVTDPLGGIDTITVNVTVTNQAPVITQGASTGMSVAVNSNCPNAANNLTLNATDSDGPLASLSWSIQTQPTTGVVSPQSGSGGAYTICYDPNDSQNAADSFVVKVTDGFGAMDTIVVNVTLTNAAPVIGQGSSTNKSVGFNSDCPNAGNNVALTATDPDGPTGSLSWSIQTQPTRGSVSPQSGTGGSFTPCYDPNNGQGMPDSFVVKVTDVFGAMATITVNVTVADNPPVITEGATLNRSVEVNSFCGFPANEITLNATDELPATLSWSVPTPPSKGFVNPAMATGSSFTFCYEPDPEQCTADSFVVRVQDGGGQFDTITVSITVTNTPPDITVGVGGQLFLQVVRNSTCPNAANQVTITATDVDTDPALLAWTIMTQPATGTVSPQTGSGTMFVPCYRPNPNQQAADFYVVKVTDSCGATDTVQVNVTVVP